MNRLSLCIILAAYCLTNRAEGGIVLTLKEHVNSVWTAPVGGGYIQEQVSMLNAGNYSLKVLASQDGRLDSLWVHYLIENKPYKNLQV